jgi:hypothetical protein
VDSLIAASNAFSGFAKMVAAHGRRPAFSESTGRSQIVEWWAYFFSFSSFRVFVTRK